MTAAVKLEGKWCDLLGTRSRKKKKKKHKSVIFLEYIKHVRELYIYIEERRKFLFSVFYWQGMMSESLKIGGKKKSDRDGWRGKESERENGGENWQVS